MDLLLCHLTEQLEGISRKKYNICLLVSLEKKPPFYCVNPWLPISKKMGIFVPCFLATVKNIIKSS